MKRTISISGLNLSLLFLTLKHHPFRSGLPKGRVFDKFLPDSLLQHDIDEIKDRFKAKDKLVN